VRALKNHYDSNLKQTHLKNLLQDKARNDVLRTDWKDGRVIFDSTHSKLDAAALDMLKNVA
jgi:glucose-6-phosphate isomerase